MRGAAVLGATEPTRGALTRTVVWIAAFSLLASVQSCGTDEVGSADGGDGTPDASADSGSDTDTDSDTDEECEGGDDCYCGSEDEYCYLACDEGGEVSSLPPGTPAELDAVCSDTSIPVVSNLAAVVTLYSIEEAQTIADGEIVVPGDLRDRVSGLPTIVFESEGAEWSTYEVTSLLPSDGGFSFHVAWPVAEDPYTCFVGDSSVTLECHVVFSVLCAEADGGVAEDAGVLDGGVGEVVDVTATTYLQWGYDTECNPGWYSSGSSYAQYCWWAWWECPA